MSHCIGYIWKQVMERLFQMALGQWWLNRQNTGCHNLQHPDKPHYTVKHHFNSDLQMQLPSIKLHEYTKDDVVAIDAVIAGVTNQRYNEDPCHDVLWKNLKTSLYCQRCIICQVSSSQFECCMLQ